MADFENTSAEIQEVAEPETEVEASEETQEVAEPVTETESPEVNSGRTAQDSAFAEQRRRIKELEEQNAELQSSNDTMFSSLQRYFDGDTAEELSINANAYAEQRDPEEYRAEWEHNREFEQLKAQNEALERQLRDVQVSQLMRDGLADIQAIDPSVKSFEDLGESFLRFVSSGLTSKEAYYATKAMDAKEGVHAPDSIGKVHDTNVERDYYTSEELDHLTDAEMDANWDKVQRSMSRLSR